MKNTWVFIFHSKLSMFNTQNAGICYFIYIKLIESLVLASNERLNNIELTGNTRHYFKILNFKANYNI